MSFTKMDDGGLIESAVEDATLMGRLGNIMF